jgi:ubiquitin
MKIIEQHLETKGTVTKYKYDFDGRKENSIQEPKSTGT